MEFKLFSRIGSVTVLNITALVFAGHSAGPTLAQMKPPESEILPFIGTWTAVHSGTPIIVLHLRSEKGQLGGGIQVCSYSVNTETTGTVDVVTDPTLSKSLPINNIKVSGKSMSFDWKDPDGDNDHWRLELTGKDDGQIVWVGLPSDVRVQPIPVSRNIPKHRKVAESEK
ncbi:MAG: hypothetical protein WB607_10830 [Candidatus Acidiferrum sp.]|jgi:hypothetical protein